MSCCENSVRDIPAWFGFVATQITFVVYLLPGFLCGFFTQSRVVSCACAAGASGAFTWAAVGMDITIALFPSLLKLKPEDVVVTFALTSFLYAPEQILSVLWSSVWFAMMATAGACAGVVLRGHLAANPSNRLARWLRVKEMWQSSEAPTG